MKSPELMPRSVRFVDQELNILEELLKLCTLGLARLAWLHMAAAIKQEYRLSGFP